MTQPAKAGEPSMEEILASIRRIIADDDTTKTASEAPKLATPVPKPAASSRAPSPPPLALNPAEPTAAAGPAARSLVDEQSADILELAEAMTTPSCSPAPPRVAPIPQFRTIERTSDVGFADMAHKPRLKPDELQLLSPETSAAVDSAFKTLTQAAQAQNARTLEDLVREMLRPMLKNWLDENLPSLVERLVRAEIERVSRGHQFS